MMIGIIEKVEAAISLLYKVPTSVLNVDNPTGNVRTCGLFVTIRTQRNEFQLPTNLSNDPVMITGFESGTITFQRNPHFEIPSILPASYNSSGIVMKCCRIRKITNTLTTHGTMRAR